MFATYNSGTRQLQITWDQPIQAIGSPVNSQLRVIDFTNGLRPSTGGHSIAGSVQSATMSAGALPVAGPPRASYSGAWIHNLAGTPAAPNGNIPLVIP